MPIRAAVSPQMAYGFTARFSANRVRSTLIVSRQAFSRFEVSLSVI